MHINGWSWQTERTVPSKSGATQRVIREVINKLRASGWSREEIFGVHLALEEGLMNAIKHGNGSDASKRVHLRCNLSPERIWIEIRDEGDGFNPAVLPDCTAEENLQAASGRGVMLMRAYMSRVEFNERGNCVTMEKAAATHARGELIRHKPSSNLSLYPQCTRCRGAARHPMQTVLTSSTGTAGRSF